MKYNHARVSTNDQSTALQLAALKGSDAGLSKDEGPVTSHDEAPYLSALDHASIESDVRPFANFIAGQVKWSLANMKA